MSLSSNFNVFGGDGLLVHKCACMYKKYLYCCFMKCLVSVSYLSSLPVCLFCDIYCINQSVAYRVLSCQFCSTINLGNIFCYLCTVFDGLSRNWYVELHKILACSIIRIVILTKYFHGNYEFSIYM